MLSTGVFESTYAIEITAEAIVLNGEKTAPRAKVIKI